VAHRRNREGVMCEVIKYTNTCSGCSCDIMENDKNGVPIGMGCEECGYTGKRRHTLYVPLEDLK
jgi:hypothetical protein